MNSRFNGCWYALHVSYSASCPGENRGKVRISTIRTFPRFVKRPGNIRLWEVQQNTTRLFPVLFRLFALERFQGVKCKSHMVTRLSFWENGSRLGCLPVFSRKLQEDMYDSPSQR